ncbi:response regulator transcription factor [Glaciecola sp. KUL10]|jgi:DNA-binding response OmpR family regulator|uniref:response regulator transcription factor n=1 Tax=Glaciecola sp. (strain KUL10) TaxID=2161813 RepID=UPI000D788BDD|nr:response regulator transcription factor [Glaciecola sp. KUL10]GBL03209.1 response regulator receiver domain-containing protein [Glaciecola sp. KUL10]
MKKVIRVLLVEDNQAIANQIIQFLESHGWDVDYASNGTQGIKLALAFSFDVIILDLNLPDIDGLQVCQKVKSEAKSNVPVLMLTARDAYEDKVKGFGLGADDYLTKPFDLRELALRCEAMSRRPKLHEDSRLKKGLLSIDTRSLVVTWGDEQIKVTKVGFNILYKLLLASPYPVSRSELIDHLWGDEPPESNALKSHIYSLRKSIEKVTDALSLNTISNIGYLLKGLDDSL